MVNVSGVWEEDIDFGGNVDVGATPWDGPNDRLGVIPGNDGLRYGSAMACYVFATSTASQRDGR